MSLEPERLNPINAFEYEREEIKMSEDQKLAFRQLTSINDVVLFPLKSDDLKEIAIDLKKFMTKNKIVVSNEETAIMLAALLLLVAGHREMAPEHVDNSCAPLKLNDVSYMACMLKKYKVIKDKDIKEKMNKSFRFLSKEMGIPIRKDIKNPIVFTAGKMDADDILSKVRRGLTKERLAGLSKKTGITEGQLVAMSLKSGAPGRIRYLKLKKVQRDNKNKRRPRFPPMTKDAVEKMVKNDTNVKLQQQIKRTSGENKEVFKFIKKNINSDIDEINNQLEKLGISKAKKAVIKKNIKVVNKKIEDEIAHRISNLKL